MTKETEYFIFLLEQYAQYSGITANKVLEKWDSLNITDFIMDMYERYHCEAIENAFEDIDELIEERSSVH